MQLYSYIYKLKGERHTIGKKEKILQLEILTTKRRCMTTNSQTVKIKSDITNIKQNKPGLHTFKTHLPYMLINKEILCETTSKQNT